MCLFFLKLHQEMNENPKQLLMILLYNDACWYKAKMFMIEMCKAFSSDAGIRENVNPLFLKETLKIQIVVFSSNAGLKNKNHHILAMLTQGCESA